jgi:hypothetical protein
MASNPSSDPPGGIKKRLQRICARLRPAPPGILDSYFKSAPGPQNALDIFRGEWSSALPPPLSDLQAGGVGLFDDDRIKWFLKEIGGVAGKAVLELGPLEGGHTYMLEKAGAAQVTALEANSRAFLRCLVVKELLGLPRSRFLCGDFMEYLRQAGPRFDVCLAAGNPVEYAGFNCTLHCQEYRTDLKRPGFCGGKRATSQWLSREDILKGLSHFGFRDLRIGYDEPRHPNGPAFAVVAAAPQERKCSA